MKETLNRKKRLLNTTLHAETYKVRGFSMLGVVIVQRWSLTYAFLRLGFNECMLT